MLEEWGSVFRVHLRLTLLLLDLGNTSKVLWTKRGTYSRLRMSYVIIYKGWHHGAFYLKKRKKKPKHILAGDVFSIINPTVKDTSVVLLVLFTIFTLPPSVHKRKLPAPLTFWSSSLVQGPFTSSGLSTFCQRCWHWPSVLPWNTATQSRTHHARTPAHLPIFPPNSMCSCQEHWMQIKPNTYREIVSYRFPGVRPMLIHKFSQLFILKKGE